MKNIIYKTGIAVAIIIQTAFMASCSMEDVELSRSVFIPDRTSPGLPVYSEWGYNTFGAYIDRVPFISGEEEPAKIYVNSDTLHFFLKGIYRNSKTSFLFSIKGLSPAEYTELTMLNDTVINLKNIACKVEMLKNDTSSVLNIIDGQIYFKRAQLLYVDKVANKTILSGEFRFRTFFGNEPVAISNGRFDVGIGYENFYNF